jgi:hypothetical protein
LIENEAEGMEVPKRLKRRESSISKSNKKADHKHIYKECLLTVEDRKRPYRAIYCIKCGKIENIYLTELEKVYVGEDMYRCVLGAQEVYDKYKDLEKFSVKDIWQKYLPIESIKDKENK